ncbi:hypothetical protein SGCOL_009022 [Colletotrichum sp. CLE4]
MWLLNTTTYELRMFIVGSTVPSYAILSHTWGSDEVTFQDIQTLPLASKKAGFTKIQGCCTQALRHNIEWAWIDSCCIDKTSSAELSEAINSMYSYYLLSRVCFVYLADVPPLSSSPPMDRLPSLASSKWFTRGWTLQELIAPRRSIFYTSDWSRLGTKGVHTDERPFIQALSSITGIFESVLAKTRQPRDYSVAERMSWAANRQTTRAEDLAYCLMGLFGVNFPVLYGEGLKHAFQRLQHEIIRTSPDETIFAWRADAQQLLMDPYTGERQSRTVTSSGVLADSPADFAHSHDVHQRALLPPSPFREFSMTNMGLSITANLVRLTPTISGGPRGSPAPQSMFVIPIGASGRPNDTSPRTRVGLYLEPVLVAASRAGHKTSYFRRVVCDKFCFASTGEFPPGELANIYILEDDQFAEMQFADRPSTSRPGSASGSGSDGGGNWSPSIGARLSLSPSPSPRPSPRASPLPRMDL